MKVALPLAKNMLAPLGVTAAMSAIDGSIQKKIHGSGATKGAGGKLIIEQEDMNDIMKIIEALENSGILLKGNVASRAKGKGIVRAGEGSKKKALNLLIPFHPLTNIEISEYYINEPKFNGVYSRNNLPAKIKKGAYVINLDEYENTGTHWIALFVKPKYTVYFDSFGLEHIPKEINTFIGNNNIKSNIFKIQAYDSIMCGYYCIEFINYMLKGKTLLDYTNLFSPNDFKKNYQIIKRIFKNE